jgi:hypothetical protein
MPKPLQKPDYFKGLLWFTFSGTAMLSAFILPIHIWILMNPQGCGSEGCEYMWMDLSVWGAELYFFVLIGAALYHSFYRVKTIAFDLTWLKTSKVLEWVLSILFFVLMGMMAVCLFDLI